MPKFQFNIDKKYLIEHDVSGGASADSYWFSVPDKTLPGYGFKVSSYSCQPSKELDHIFVIDTYEDFVFNVIKKVRTTEEKFLKFDQYHIKAKDLASVYLKEVFDKKDYKYCVYGFVEWTKRRGELIGTKVADIGIIDGKRVFSISDVEEGNATHNRANENLVIIKIISSAEISKYKDFLMFWREYNSLLNKKNVLEKDLGTLTMDLKNYLIFSNLTNYYNEMESRISDALRWSLQTSLELESLFTSKAKHLFTKVEYDKMMEYMPKIKVKDVYKGETE